MLSCLPRNGVCRWCVCYVLVIYTPFDRLTAVESGFSTFCASAETPASVQVNFRCDGPVAHAKLLGSP